jgi:effector-binding domain-containing protein
MSLQEAGIEHKSLGATLVATARCEFHNRSELRTILADVARAVPSECVVGPAFCIFQFVTSVRDGFDGEAGWPVSRPVESAEVHSRVLPGTEVLSLTHHGPVERIRETVATLYSRGYQHGLVSDEFMREVYLDSDNPEGHEIEVQFVVHDWIGLLGQHACRVLGAEASREVMRGSGTLSLESTLGERFSWVKGAMERLDGTAGEQQKYDTVSSCAHVFPARQIEKLRLANEGARASGDDPLQAVDAVLDWMAADPCWGERPRREGRVIYSSKKPREPQAHKAATNTADRRRAYCFCPIIRSHLDEGMSPTFCYCGSGWYRRQWEGALGKPVRIDIVESLLKGDDRCTFAIHLPDDL